MTDFDTSITLLSYNIRYETDGDVGPDHWENRKASLARYLKASQADVVALQEVTPNQRAYLREQLGGEFELIGCRPDEAVQPENNVVCFKTSRFELMRSRVYFLAHNYSSEAEPSTGHPWYRFLVEARWRREQLIGAIEPRVVTCVELLDKLTRKSCCIFNAHFDISPGCSYRQACILTDKIVPTFLNDSTCAHVIMGDFNATSQSSVPTLFHTRGYQDASGVMDDTLNCDLSTFCTFDLEREPVNHHMPCICANHHIDWIFAKGHSGKELYKVHQDDVHENSGVKRRLSDHHPISTVISI